MRAAIAARSIALWVPRVSRLKRKGFDHQREDLLNQGCFTDLTGTRHNLDESGRLFETGSEGSCLYSLKSGQCEVLAIYPIL